MVIAHAQASLLEKVLIQLNVIFPKRCDEWLVNVAQCGCIKHVIIAYTEQIVRNFSPHLLFN